MNHRSGLGTGSGVTNPNDSLCERPVAKSEDINVIFYINFILS